MEEFKTWAIVELFGHQIIAGEVSEQIIANEGFIRIDVPDTEGIKAYTKLFGPKAIYGMTPTDEETARRAAGALRRPPIEAWRLNLPEISQHASQEHEGHSEDDDDRYRPGD